MSNKDFKDKYEHVDDLVAFGFLANALGGGGDKGQAFPYSDAEDLSRGLRFIPGAVTMARRRGERAPFVQPCIHPCCWYWQFENGARLHYWEREDYEAIARANGKEKNEQGVYPLGAGPCPDCGNPHTQGGRSPGEDKNKDR